MCNINVIINPNGQDHTAGLSHASANSYADNNDGDGLFMSNGAVLLKSKHKLDYTTHRQRIKNSRFIVTHQRIATSGFNTNMLHPFSNKRFILVHNGIIQYPYKRQRVDTSDTHNFFNDFVKHYGKTSDVKTAIEDAIKETDGGSFSIFIYDKKEAIGYYFKSISTKMAVFKLKGGGLFLTTEAENKMFFSIKTELVPQENILYSFFIDPKKKQVGIIDEGNLESLKNQKCSNNTFLSSYGKGWDYGGCYGRGSEDYLGSYYREVEQYKAEQRAEQIRKKQEQQEAEKQTTEDLKKAFNVDKTDKKADTGAYSDE